MDELKLLIVSTFYEKRRLNELLIDLVNSNRDQYRLITRKLLFPESDYMADSFLIKWVSVVESELKRLLPFCCHLNYKQAMTMPFNVCLSRFSESSGGELCKTRVWREIQWIRQIRNIIIHQNGEFMDDEQYEKMFSDTGFRGYVGNHSLVYKTQQFRPTIQYCKHLMKVFDRFFILVFRQCFRYEPELLITGRSTDLEKLLSRFDDSATSIITFAELT